MITEPVLIDTGPIVALLHTQDQYHVRCREQAALLAGAVYTSWPVVTEAAWLLRKLPDGMQRLLQLLAGQDIVCLNLEAASASWLAAIEAQFASLSPQLADLSLLYLAEQHDIRTIFTLDRRDFLVYRRTNGEPFRLLPEAP